MPTKYITAAWIQVNQRVIISALFLDHLHLLAYFSLLAEMSDRLQQRKLRLKQIILDLNKEIDKLLQETKSRNITKDRKEQINTDLMNIYEQISDMEQSLVLFC